MIYDYQNQYWDDCPASNPHRKVTIEQHLAWPETRISNLLTWFNRDDMDGWGNQRVMGLMYEQLASADIVDEAHF